MIYKNWDVRQNWSIWIVHPQMIGGRWGDKEEKEKVKAMQRRGEESHECWSRLDYQMVSCQGLNQLSNSNLNLSSSSALRQHNLGTLAVYHYLKNISSVHHLCSAPSCFAYCSPPTRSTPSASDSIYNSLMTLKILLAPAIAVSNEL